MCSIDDISSMVSVKIWIVYKSQEMFLLTQLLFLKKTMCTQRPPDGTESMNTGYDTVL